MNLYLRDLIGIIFMAVAILMYRLFTRVVEKRPAVEMSARGSVSETGLGFLLGAGIMTFMVALLWVLSYYRIDSVGSWEVILHALLFFGLAALGEEIVFRAILFRHIEELAGTWGAIIFTGLLFGFAHIGNPNATVFTSVAIALQCLIVSACWVLTRRLWLVWGLHVGWNYFQGTIFGVTVSGEDELETLVTSTRSGPDWLTGGDFGIEGSYVSIAICVVVGVLLIMRAARAGQILGPLWVRKVREVEPPAEPSIDPHPMGGPPTDSTI
ncbi:MAG: CPBP family intramembrane metalloprotease [Candidatus Zixiibacteriota bacterium]|nr:MAG: CPBP family intramembrane metalloprotease [candidate division Zixibacteria bacterium]